ncbi:hypothetical protein ACIGHB_09155 [Streptomyces sp. NPDC085460]|uniref:hypothetical protein n=1 Tax=Streptomyces sp. NPDC085460 TaxID=3365723 RepID=UPI0037D33708
MKTIVIPNVMRALAVVALTAFAMAGISAAEGGADTRAAAGEQITTTVLTGADVQEDQGWG